MQKLLITFLVTLLTGTAQAQIYRCTMNGETLFSQLPCAADAELIELDYPRHDPLNNATASAALSQTQSRNVAMAKERRVRELGYRIERLEANNRTLLRNRDRDLTTLRTRQGQANDNLAGALYRQSLAEEMSAINQRYDTLVNLNTEQVRQLRKERVQLIGVE